MLKCVLSLLSISEGVVLPLMQTRGASGTNDRDATRASARQIR